LASFYSAFGRTLVKDFQIKFLYFIKMYETLKH